MKLGQKVDSLPEVQNRNILFSAFTSGTTGKRKEVLHTSESLLGAPHIPAMRQNLARALGCDQDCINIKATTEEHLGFTGEGLGMAAHAVCLIESI